MIKNIEKINLFKPILALGLDEDIEELARELNIDVIRDICYIPTVTTHYTQYKDVIKEFYYDMPPMIVTQSMEMIDVLLTSGLDFQVVAMRNRNSNLCVRVLTKEQTIELREEYEMELRI